MKTLTPIQEFYEFMEQHNKVRFPDYFIGNDLYAKYKELLEKEKEIMEEIIDIIDSENSGYSAEQRLNEIKEYIKIFDS